MAVTWVRIEHWHAVRNFKQHKSFDSVCGYHWDAFTTELVTDEQPHGCEDCLAILAEGTVEIASEDVLVEEEPSPPRVITEP